MGKIDGAVLGPGGCRSEGKGGTSLAPRTPPPRPAPPLTSVAGQQERESVRGTMVHTLV